ncbi:MAG: hypothetical protein HY526_00640 [Betaproteobacteria bacterium]|nr:hypothetical protein [Betaproteobacteria bacterium]
MSLDSASCKVCHPRQHSAWIQTLHAQAFSPGTAGRPPAFVRDEQQDCLRCHAPRAEQQSEWFARVLSARLDGVNCAACHVRDGTRLGPRVVDPTPHGRVEGRALFKQSEFCAACH